MSQRQSAKELVEKAEVIATEIELKKSKAEIVQWKRKYKQILTAATALEEKIEVLLGLQDKPLLQNFERQKRRKGKSNGVAVVVPATDWHVEEIVESEAVNFKNCHNLTEAEARIKRLYGKIPRLLDWQNNLAPVTELWHPLLGDLISGYIHEDLTESNALSPTEASVFLQEMICSGIDLLLRETKLPIFVPTCQGNHGRTTPRKRIKTSYKNSYEWLLYMTLAKFYAGNKRVRFDVGKGYHNVQTIMGRKVRFHHGDGLRYQGGVGGITIPVNKAVAQWNKAGEVDFDIFGHWHTHLVNYPTWISCGSLMGYSEYSVEIKADFQHPTQTWIVIDRDYGLTSALPIFVTQASINYKLKKYRKGTK
jgi:hypothetical protein